MAEMGITSAVVLARTARVARRRVRDILPVVLEDKEMTKKELERELSVLRLAYAAMCASSGPVCCARLLIEDYDELCEDTDGCNECNGAMTYALADCDDEDVMV